MAGRASHAIMSMDLYRVLFSGKMTLAAWDEADATVRASKILAHQFPADIKIDSGDVQKVEE